MTDTDWIVTYRDPQDDEPTIDAAGLSYEEAVELRMQLTYGRVWHREDWADECERRPS